MSARRCRRREKTNIYAEKFEIQIRAIAAIIALIIL